MGMTLSVVTGFGFEINVEDLPDDHPGLDEDGDGFGEWLWDAVATPGPPSAPPGLLRDESAHFIDYLPEGRPQYAVLVRRTAGCVYDTGVFPTPASIDVHTEEEYAALIRAQEKVFGSVRADRLTWLTVVSYG